MYGKKIQPNQNRGLSQVEINSFKQIYEARFGTKLSDQDALAMGLRLLNLMRAVYKPIERST